MGKVILHRPSAPRMARQPGTIAIPIEVQGLGVVVVEVVEVVVAVLLTHVFVSVFLLFSCAVCLFIPKRMSTFSAALFTIVVVAVPPQVTRCH